jgi:hypothetical protein
LKISISFILLFLSVCPQAQTLDSLELEVRDSLDINGFDSTIYEKPKAGLISNFMFQFDNRTERYYDVKARMNGVKIGFEFYRRFRTGFGFYQNNNYYQMNFPDSPESQRFLARMDYQTWFSELVLFRSFRWEVSTIYARGTGSIRLQTYDNKKSIPELVKEDTISNFKLYDIGINTHFKVFPWFGLGVGVGYRQITLPNYPELQGPFSGPYVDFKIKVFLGYAYRAIFKPDKIIAEQKYYEQRSRKRWSKFNEIFINR